LPGEKERHVTTTPRRRFELILIKPSHYDDDGYVIQWFRSIIPSNTLAALHGLAVDCAERFVLGADVEIVVTALDETNTRILPRQIIRRINEADGFGMVGLVGVQSNQFPRALDIARPLREAGLRVVIGGFHVSGCMAMLPGMQPDLQRALDLGVTLFSGEAEFRLDELLVDAAKGSLKPIYDHAKDLPGIEGAPIPFMPKEVLKRNFYSLASFDAGRGCPFQCSFCTIINVQGRKSRRRSPDDIEQIIRRRGFIGFSSPTTISLATRIGKRFSIGSSSCVKKKASSRSGSQFRLTRNATIFRISSKRRVAPTYSICSSAWRASTQTISSP
jgi:hypothetical protein